jgi:hypothetical protein
MPLDGSVEATALAHCLERENPELSLPQAMFEVRPPATKVVGRLAPRAAGRLLLPVSGVGSELIVFTKLITKKEVTALVGQCRDHKRLMAQNAHLVRMAGVTTPANIGPTMRSGTIHRTAS